MSRAYRIRVRESLHRVIRAEDHVSAQLELLDILPAGEMGDLLGRELEQQGFERQGNLASRTDGQITVTVDLETGQVTVQAEASENVALRGEKQGLGYDDDRVGRREQERRLRDQLREGMEKEAEAKADSLREQVTNELEAALVDLKEELDRSVNRTTAEALKQKAARIGQIKEMTDDPESGSLTIVVEV